LTIAKEQAIELLSTDVEHLFEPIEAALSYKIKQADNDAAFEGFNAEETEQKKEEEKQAAILANQEAANKLLEAIYGQ
jgi:hypothetical protein